MAGAPQISNLSDSSAIEVKPLCARVLGVPVHIVDISEALGLIEAWIARRDRTRWIALTNSHGVIEGFKRPEFKTILESADLSLPDGMWTARAAARRAAKLPMQVRAIDFFMAFCHRANQKGYTNFFLGDTKEVLDQLREKLRTQFPALQIAGTFSPPFRGLSPSEDKQIVEAINGANPDVLWVGLGLPKQERWIHSHLTSLRAPVIVAIGATLKFASGKVKPAPRQVSRVGLEWFWRLMTEPRKVWRRALVYGPQFALHTYLESKGLRKYE